jgi:NADP-dependent 3-hydroxy acid dehydrogenase YdfG
MFLGGRNAQRLEAVARACSALGATVETALLDVTDNAAAEAWVLAADRRAPLDLLITGAGVNAGPEHPGHPESLDSVKRMMATNFFGQLAVATPVLERMIERGQGHVAFVASLGAYHGLAGFPAYCASKAAIRAYSQGLRDTVGPAGVAVSVISPGFVDTPMCAQLVAGGKPFLLSPVAAARVIRRGLDAGRGEIAFPPMLVLGLKLLALLPEPLARLFLAGFRYTVAARREDPRPWTRS